MSKPRVVNAHCGGERLWYWTLEQPNGSRWVFDDRYYKTEAAAQRAAEKWLRAALKQASKKLNDSTKE